MKILKKRQYIAQDTKQAQHPSKVADTHATAPRYERDGVLS